MDNFGVITEVGTENIQGDHIFMIHGPKANVLQAARQTVSLLDTPAAPAATPQAQAQPQQAELPVPAPPPLQQAEAQQYQQQQYQQQLYAQPDAAAQLVALQPQAAGASQLTPQQQLEYYQLQQAAAAGAAA
ncbi:unnamed protein product [Prorocentrum cordatum]|uniref:Uncharacterized protein n=1 Tax=Prorocentrum cordatum TaxID=2364126 RepID=A0ABN9XFQ4_9DINO|nr:unnamed protein product [Polarella glacialis]